MHMQVSLAKKRLNANLGDIDFFDVPNDIKWQMTPKKFNLSTIAGRTTKAMLIFNVS